MSRDEYWRQCGLRQGASIMSSWLPERGAKVGARVELLDNPPGNDPWWTVISVGTRRVTLAEVQGMQREQRHWRDDGSLVEA